MKLSIIAWVCSLYSDGFIYAMVNPDRNRDSVVIQIDKNADPEFYTISEVVKLLKLSVVAISKKYRAGKLLSVKITGNEALGFAD